MHFMQKTVKTLILSDIHLGSKHSKTKEVSRFLKQISCEQLILNGDIIDGWQIQKKGIRWQKKHSRFIKAILRMLEKENTKIIYIRGNHDDFLKNFIPFSFHNLSIVNDYILTSGQKKYYVTHGDVFDSITRNLKWLSKLGDIGYTLLLQFNRIYNQYRRRKGMPYFSISQYIKNKVKGAVSYISDFEEELVRLARVKNCDGVICGHIHHPANQYLKNIHYLNSGDWVESLSALAEDFEGNWSILYYKDLIQD
ncbi:MAG: UDP-2,3-diacylglucosamine diphosphatase [Bacteroidales bacterium]|nr:UDP-2,3-diacylglucosamine diphosphatase [Bacteroidales bacterium]